MSELAIWVYIIRGENGLHYTGMTKDLDRRIREHRNGASKSTRRYGKIEILWVQVYASRKIAREMEVLIKKKGAARFIKTYGGKQ